MASSLLTSPPRGIKDAGKLYTETANKARPQPHERIHLVSKIYQTKKKKKLKYLICLFNNNSTSVYIYGYSQQWNIFLWKKEIHDSNCRINIIRLYIVIHFYYKKSHLI